MNFCIDTSSLQLNCIPFYRCIGCPAIDCAKKNLNTSINFQPNELIFSEDNMHNNVHIHQWMFLDTSKSSQFFSIDLINTLKKFILE